MEVEFRDVEAGTAVGTLTAIASARTVDVILEIIRHAREGRDTS